MLPPSQMVFYLYNILYICFAPFACKILLILIIMVSNELENTALLLLLALVKYSTRAAARHAFAYSKRLLLALLSIIMM